MIKTNNKVGIEKKHPKKERWLIPPFFIQLWAKWNNPNFEKEIWQTIKKNKWIIAIGLGFILVTQSITLIMVLILWQIAETWGIMEEKYFK